MKLQKFSKQILLVILTGLFVTFLLCSKGEVVKINGLLPEGAVAELTHAYPDFKVTLVAEADANVSVKFGEKFLCVTGIEDEKARERTAKYVVEHLNNPNKAAEDAAKREAYNNLPPKERLASLVQRIKERNPDFEYKWTRLGEGNVKVEYGYNSRRMTGIEHGGAREEWAHAIIGIQKEIDKTSKGDVEGGER